MQKGDASPLLSLITLLRKKNRKCRFYCSNKKKLERSRMGKRKAKGEEADLVKTTQVL